MKTLILTAILFMCAIGCAGYDVAPGEPGAPGEDGAPGQPGEDGQDGQNGTDGTLGDTYLVLGDWTSVHLPGIYEAFAWCEDGDRVLSGGCIEDIGAYPVELVNFGPLVDSTGDLAEGFECIWYYPTPTENDTIVAAKALCEAVE